MFYSSKHSLNNFKMIRVRDEEKMWKFHDAHSGRRRKSCVECNRKKTTNVCTFLKSASGWLEGGTFNGMTITCHLTLDTLGERKCLMNSAVRPSSARRSTSYRRLSVTQPETIIVNTFSFKCVLICEPMRAKNHSISTRLKFFCASFFFCFFFFCSVLT